MGNFMKSLLAVKDMMSLIHTFVDPLENFSRLVEPNFCLQKPSWFSLGKAYSSIYFCDSCFTNIFH